MTDTDRRAAYDRARRETQPWRGWYGRARWARLRELVFAEEPLCRMCTADGETQVATVVDHIVPHRGDPDLFWDRGNLQPLCKACHDGRKARMERRGVAGFDDEGYAIPLRDP